MTQPQIKHFRSALLKWFYKNKRDLPWRKNRTWYKTYLSEIILQQTTVEQGLPYFLKFLKKYPDIKKLAVAEEQEILNVWAGLGYYSRARNMHKAAQIIVSNFNAQFPSNYKDALKIPGVGPYTASAILSIVFREPLPVVDGNVIRVICRVFAINNDVRLNETLNRIKIKADILLDKTHPGDFNESLMELGATVCTAKKALCSKCPVSEYCLSYRKNYVNQIPFKSPAAAKHKKYQIAFVLKNDSRILIVQRPSKGLLAGMWELPAFEINHNQFENGSANLLKKLNLNPFNHSDIFRHIYSHIDLKYKAYVAEFDNKEIRFANYIDQKWIKLNEAGNFAIHNAHNKIIDWYKKDILKIKAQR